MASAEQRVWDRFLTSPNNFYLNFHYNVRVGEIPPAPLGEEDPFRKMWRLNNMSRIDAVGIAEEIITLFEVKVSAGLGAIGQAISYKILADIESDDPRPIEAAIVSDGIRPDVITVAMALGIKTFTI